MFDDEADERDTYLASKRMTCDFYSREEWNQAATQIAGLMQEHVFDRHFGVCPWFVERYFVFFGNEGPSHVSAMVETVRQEIEIIEGMKEVGFGTSEDGYSWAVIVSAEKVFADGTDEVCEIMQQAISRAWRIARGFFDDKPDRG